MRDLTIMMLLFETGMRANEIIGIALSDIRWEDSQLLIRNAKGQRERFCSVTGEDEGSVTEIYRD
ncbi:tyrosine-type recombinase/integrase [Fictibacillus sp. KU28468]|uniref:tyrosine-type recombinase/integrase n=1 Tax=Fictibacillus sp. KU28468 TaxID=2991053 RepID=UPI00223D340C|nr:tyrosine-type recombinase/integrase [Fictibacillus sp. KU28468]UZJ78297.1 site-specific integrase [Fictibacillus sp. KU28468]